MVQDFYHPPWSLCVLLFCGLGSHFLKENSQFLSNKIRFTAWIPEPGCSFWGTLWWTNVSRAYLHSNSQDDFQETLCKLLESPSAPRVRSNLSRHLWNHGNWGNYPLNSHVSGQWMIIIHPESMGVLLFLSSLLFPVSLLPVSHGVYHITCSSRS
jgi:hypothetical protein